MRMSNVYEQSGENKLNLKISVENHIQFSAFPIKNLTRTENEEYFNQRTFIAI